MQNPLPTRIKKKKKLAKNVAQTAKTHSEKPNVTSKQEEEQKMVFMPDGFKDPKRNIVKNPFLMLFPIRYTEKTRNNREKESADTSDAGAGWSQAAGLRRDR